ncbi:MAG: GNAT family N-acetyltransferase [Anaerobacillus sp.]|uniref:GNAT family N-acetyltransferase n=1 Tax=Anaerobacillus sp. TaxID=1872506 RepID=UPI00391A8930
MLYLEAMDDPLAEESLIIQEDILNSDQYFLHHAEGKLVLTREQIINEIFENSVLGASFYYIKQAEDCIGLIYYILGNPYDRYCWLSLFIIHKNYQKSGTGYKSYQLFEEKLRQMQSIDKIRLCAQVQNKRGNLFWERNGYNKIALSRDKKHFLINIYEKSL